MIQLQMAEVNEVSLAQWLKSPPGKSYVLGSIHRCNHAFLWFHLYYISFSNIIFENDYIQSSVLTQKIFQINI